MDFKYIFSVVSFLMVLVSVCEGQIRCYVCSTIPGGEYSNQCGDNFRLQSIHASKCYGSCQKTRGYRDEGGRRVVEVTRSCVNYAGDECRTGQHMGITADICTCTEELCNSSTTLTFSHTAAVLSLLVYRLFW